MGKGTRVMLVLVAITSPARTPITKKAARLHRASCSKCMTTTTVTTKKKKKKKKKKKNRIPG